MFEANSASTGLQKTASQEADFRRKKVTTGSTVFVNSLIKAPKPLRRIAPGKAAFRSVAVRLRI
jgi:hypothetical protein